MQELLDNRCPAGWEVDYLWRRERAETEDRVKERKVGVENDGERERGCHVTNIYSAGLNAVRRKNTTHVLRPPLYVFFRQRLL